MPNLENENQLRKLIAPGLFMFLGIFRRRVSLPILGSVGLLLLSIRVQLSFF